MTTSRSHTYICTLSTYDEEKIAAVRAVVTKSNLLNRLINQPTRYQLKVRPRLGKNNPYRALYAQGGRLHRYSSQDIKREHGQRFDLYINKRY